MRFSRGGGAIFSFGGEALKLWSEVCGARVRKVMERGVVNVADEDRVWGGEGERFGNGAKAWYLMNRRLMQRGSST